MQYLFILGRNPELSEAELNSFLKIRGIKILKRQIKDNALFLEFNESANLEHKELTFLGGVIAIGEVISEAKKKELDANLKSVYGGNKNNITYAVWNFSDDKRYDFLLDYLKGRFREEKLKASKKNLTGILELQNGKEMEIVGNKVDAEYFIYDDFFGKIFFRTDYGALEFRDISKPYKRESLTISPRLAKIMINLSETKKDEKIVDCFCGIGSIMTEALIQEIKIIGVDIDKSAIDMAKKNLQWMKFNSEMYSLINGDSRDVKIENVKSLVSEPDLGETFREVPSKEKALLFLDKYEKLMIRVLNNMKHYVSGKFVFTAPYVITKDKRSSCDINKIAKLCRLRIVGTYKEFRKEQIVGREIIIFQH